jgi:hypothetical protein
MKYLLITLISIASLFVDSCNAQAKLPKQMPNDFKIILYERLKDSSPTSYRIDAETLVVGRGSGWHNRSQTETKIPRQTVENLYKTILKNCFDQIENYSSGENKPLEQDVSITVSFGKTTIIVYDGLLHLTAENSQRFEIIKQEILELAKLEEKKK